MLLILLTPKEVPMILGDPHVQNLRRRGVGEGADREQGQSPEAPGLGINFGHWGYFGILENKLKLLFGV